MAPLTSRRGFTLVELLVAMLLLLVVMSGIYRLLNSTQRISRAQAERVDMQSNMRAGTLILPAELREVGYDTIPNVSGNPNTNVPDIQMATGDSIQFRAIRGSGIICQISTGINTQMAISTGVGYSQLRNLTASDSLLVFVDGNPSLASDDRWIARGISSIGYSSTACPAGWPWGTAGFTVNISSWTASNVRVGLSGTFDDLTVRADSVTVGSPVKFFEVMRYGVYQDGTKNMLGAKRLNYSGAREPVLGPLAASGFHLTYYDSTGTAITPSAADIRSRIRTIRISMIAASDQGLSSSGAGGNRQVVDSVVTTVALRNSITR